ncbi:DNA-binding transcriptional regulator, XRE-family HTH domain [Pseudobacteriovorax antillogorgiicola]|uniref:DNA-binding transcriptional regulator, XRE-family HTH domain n=1 Tax=Pseudobacteriovorax antillogorgiicola TaxID=1513793 RepID=A0A1Y6BPB1_9BACT|nr:DNA-binding XRE family transcriptional regulator [Pseudobacteriovorax antillogorgiicola]SMF11363.1 DNA-binding transcriptional regulator, XRE-family HTH domain [Pseudobacteriovorax antillogorgiicola]
MGAYKKLLIFYMVDTMERAISNRESLTKADDRYLPAHLATKITFLRKLLRMSQAKLASQAGVSLRSIQRMESQETDPLLSHMMQVAKALSVTLSDLFAPTDQRLRQVSIQCSPEEYDTMIHTIRTSDPDPNNIQEQCRRLIAQVDHIPTQSLNPQNAFILSLKGYSKITSKVIEPVDSRFLHVIANIFEKVVHSQDRAYIFDGPLFPHQGLGVQNLISVLSRRREQSRLLVIATHGSESPLN